MQKERPKLSSDNGIPKTSSKVIMRFRLAGVAMVVTIPLFGLKSGATLGTVVGRCASRSFNNAVGMQFL